MSVEAVTFDFWSTLVREDPTVWEHRLAAWSAILTDIGNDADEATIKAAFDVGWKAYLEAWRDNRPFGAADALESMLAHLGVAPDPEVVAALLAVITEPPTDRFPTLNPNVLGCLDALQSAEVRIGIVCDVGLTPSTVLRRYLDQQGALGYFDHWSFSDEVGVYKPDRRIFEHALEGLGGIEPGRAAHVGDLRRTDIMGARTMGILAVRYRGVHDDPVDPDSPVVEGDHVIDDHLDLPVVLGLD